MENITTNLQSPLSQSLKVLDKGFVRLVDYMGNDLSVVRAARVSYDAAWRAGNDQGSDKRLIKYLWKNAHTSPFEAVTFTFEVKAPIFVVRQWHRHRTWSYNELSGRYRELPFEYYLPEENIIGEQSESNKQGRQPTQEDRQLDLDKIKDLMESVESHYRYLLNRGWPKELARIVLPVSTYTHMFASVDLLNLFRFITLRSHDHAQYEIRQYSDALLQLIEPIVPACVEAFNEQRK